MSTQAIQRITEPTEQTSSHLEQWQNSIVVSALCGEVDFVKSTGPWLIVVKRELKLLCTALRIDSKFLSLKSEECVCPESHLIYSNGAWHGRQEPRKHRSAIVAEYSSCTWRFFA